MVCEASQYTSGGGGKRKKGRIIRSEQCSFSSIDWCVCVCVICVMWSCRPPPFHTLKA